MSFRSDVVAFSDRLDAAALVLKGYPEFRSDEARDQSGRWSSGGGSTSRSKKDPVVADLDRRFKQIMGNRFFRQHRLRRLAEEIYYSDDAATDMRALRALERRVRRAAGMEQQSRPWLNKGYPEYRPDQARGPDGRWSGGGGSARSKKPKGVTDATIQRRAAKRQKELQAAVKQGRAAVAKAKALPKDASPSKIGATIEALRAASKRQQELRDSIRRDGEAAASSLRTSSLLLSIAVLGVETMLAIKAVELMGAIHPVAGVVTAGVALAYMSMQVYDLIKGTHEAGKGDSPDRRRKDFDIFGPMGGAP